MPISDIRQRIAYNRALRSCEPQEISPLQYYPRHEQTRDLYYYEAGNPDADVTVVFVHGFTLAAAAWHMQVEHLGDRARCILVDYRGHGLSKSQEDLDITGAADDLYRVLEDAGVTGPCIFAGHSLGGMVVLNVLRRYERARELCAYLLLVSSAIDAFATEGVTQILELPVVERVREFAEVSPKQARTLRRAISKFMAPTLKVTVFHTPTPPEIIRFHADLIADTPLETMVGYLDDLKNHEECEAAAAIAAIPGLVMVGDEDTVTPIAQAERLVELWPQAGLQIIPGAGHMIPIEQPWAVNNALEYALDELAAQSS